MPNFYRKKNIKRLCVIIAVVAVIFILLGTIGPYVFVINSIPGQVSLSNEDRQKSLSNPVECVEQVSHQKQKKILSNIANFKTDKYALDNRDDVVSLSRIILANFLINQDIE